MRNVWWRHCASCRPTLRIKFLLGLPTYAISRTVRMWTGPTRGLRRISRTCSERPWPGLTSGSPTSFEAGRCRDRSLSRRLWTRLRDERRARVRIRLQKQHNWWASAIAYLREKRDIPLRERLFQAGIVLLFWIYIFYSYRKLIQRALAYRLWTGASCFLLLGGLFSMQGRIRWILFGVGIGLFLAGSVCNFYLPGGGILGAH
jgi:hypothetical protein